mmetsp:Transcript_30369/g.34517  ORF Transcript_30369/g.34517 Transcript_30369/m.34517 type:complete len:114 (+) Transcript_30369:883-1224(+)
MKELQELGVHFVTNASNLLTSLFSISLHCILSSHHLCFSFAYATSFSLIGTSSSLLTRKLASRFVCEKVTVGNSKRHKNEKDVKLSLTSFSTSFPGCSFPSLDFSPHLYLSLS